MDDRRTLGDKIRRLREAKGWSQGKLSAKMGLNNSAYISKLERGEIETPTFERIALMARALGVPDWELTGGAPPPGAGDTSFALALGDLPGEVDGAEVIAKFDALSPEYKALWLSTLDLFYNQEQAQKKSMRAAMQAQRRVTQMGQSNPPEAAGG